MACATDAEEKTKATARMPIAYATMRPRLPIRRWQTLASRHGVRVVSVTRKMRAKRVCGEARARKERTAPHCEPACRGPVAGVMMIFETPW